MERLDEIVNILERNDVELEEAISLFEEGLKLVKACDEQLHTFEDKVQALVEGYEKNE